jgi:hypothetical protein
VYGTHIYERRNKRRKRDLLLVHWQPMLKLGINKRNHRIWNIFFLTAKSYTHIQWYKIFDIYLSNKAKRKTGINC